MIEELAPAKINLALDILNKRADGFHEIDTVFHSINLSDSIYVQDSTETIFSCNGFDLPCGKGNLAYESLLLLRKYTGIKKGVKLHLRKRVPAGAGLGGGSADAAAVLRALNRFWELNLSLSELLDLALKLGSDVPFCIQGGAARATGRGELLTLLNPLPEIWLAIIMPNFTIQTKTAYKFFETYERSNYIDVTGVAAAVDFGDRDLVWRRMGNIFQDMLLPYEPRLVKMHTSLARIGFPLLMSGSGASFFMVLPHPMEGARLLEKMNVRNPDWRIYITKTGGRYL